MPKQLPVSEEHIVCDVCGRTMLKGEQAEPYLTPSRERRLVCQLCAPRAQKEGWIRESAEGATPAQPPRSRERRRFWPSRRAFPSRIDSRAGGEPEPGGTDPEADRREEARSLDPTTDPEPKGRFRRNPRHVRAVPTNAQLKVDRAVDLFNTSEHARTVAGIARTLGSPHASALPSLSSAAEVLITVAWELSWYRYVVDLSDSREAVRLQDRGQELQELPAEAREWNIEAQADGTLATASGARSDGENLEHAL